MVQNERALTFLTVPCVCGRSLRAKSELAGTQVRCWDCHRLVLVPTPRQGQKVARQLSEDALTVIQGPGLNSVLAVAAIVTLALSTPRFGAWVSTALLTLGASAYGETIRRISRGPTDGPEPGWSEILVPGSIPKLILCLTMAAGTVVPLWWWNADLHRSPRFDAIGRTAAATTWVLLPILMLIAFGRTEQGIPIGIRGCLKLCASHPFATALSLALVPISLILVEIGIALLVYLPGNLPFFALDYMPIPRGLGTPVIYLGIPYFRLNDFRAYPASIFYQSYLDGLRQGYSFVGAIPASLSLSSRAGLSGDAIGLFEPFYTIIRLLIVIVVVTCLLTAFAIQARWLGSIPAMDRRRPS